VSVSSRSFPAEVQRREVRKVEAGQLEKCLIAPLNHANAVRFVDTEAFGAGVMLREAWGQSKETLLWPASQPLAGGPQGRWWDAKPVPRSMLGACLRRDCARQLFPRLPDWMRLSRALPRRRLAFRLFVYC